MVDPFSMNNLNERSRAFVFTTNNPSSRNTPVLETLGAKYLIYGRETAPVTGTPHLQGYVYFSNARTLRTVVAKLPGSHVAVARGSCKQNYEYCTKAGDYDEYGEKPLNPEEKGEEEKERWRRTLSCAKEGKLDDIEPEMLVRYYGALKRIRNDFKVKPGCLESTCGIWIYGSSGCGKSYAVQNTYPDHYKKGHNKWWDGYDGEDVAYIDDLGRGDKWLGEFYLKHWSDRYPFAAESKGFCGQIRPKKFIVTSQYRIEDIWEDKETIEALKRRFIVIEKVINQNIII